ncbi:MAG TPA: tetratricopeptide repeat protein [Alphaproteobacteria bacterium]|nr:tetratricopeptide repeat protein [Alphaproteobacteria bacterium]
MNIKNLTTESAVRGLLLAFAFVLPILYDLAVPEVSGDIRWTATHLVAGLGALAITLKLLVNGWPKEKAAARTPWIYPLAVGLCIWAAVSLVDSMNIYRGIMMFKALYAQMLLIAVAAYVWNGTFARRLTWALVLPVAFAAPLGMAQFFAYSDTAMAAAIGNWWPHPGFIIDQLLGYYQQSAIPGSSFANKNLAGSWTGMMLPLIMYLLVTSKTWRGRGVASVLLALGSLFLLYARARASWVALLFSCLVMVGLMLVVPVWRKEIFARFAPRQWLWLLPAVVLVAFAGGAISPVKGAHSVGASVADNASALLNPTFDDVGGRVAYNLNSIAITADHWFNGVGLGAFHAIYPAYYNAIIVTPKNSYNVLARPQRTHTDLMEAFDEMGVPGGILYASVFIWGIVAAWGMRRPAAVAKVGLWPLFAGWSLLTICVNALMDFPMQLPTAPAVCVMLMGGLVWHQRQLGTAGFKLKHVTGYRAPRPVLLAWLAVLLVANYAAMWDSWYYRQANIQLKAAMIRIFSGVNDDITLQMVENANRIYPYDARIHEHMAVVYANYTGQIPLSLETRIAKVEEELKEDPWGPNHLINVSGLYLQLAEMNAMQGHPEVAVKALARASELYRRLLVSADFSHYTYGVGGMIALLQGNAAQAVPLFGRALAIEPGYEPAKQGLARAEKILSATAPAAK